MSEIIKYEGSIIRRRDEHMCLTDMWKATGADRSKRPVKWLASEQAKTFIAFLGDTVVQNLDYGLITVEKGGANGGATWAHWQLAFAYAKYLSPAFHAWCNEVVRQHVEGTLAAGPDPETIALIDRQAAALTLALRRLSDVEVRMRVLSEHAQSRALVHHNHEVCRRVRNRIAEAAQSVGVSFKAMEGVIREHPGWNVPSYRALLRSDVEAVLALLDEYKDGVRLFVPGNQRRRMRETAPLRRPVIAKSQMKLKLVGGAPKTNG